MQGKIEGKRRSGWQRMRWLYSITNSVDMNLSKLRETMEDRGAWHATVHEVTKSWTQLSNDSGSDGKESACSAGDLGSIPGLGRTPGGGNGYPLQCSGLENSMDCIVHGVAKSQIQLNEFHLHILTMNIERNDMVGIEKTMILALSPALKKFKVKPCK